MYGVHNFNEAGSGHSHMQQVKAINFNFGGEDGGIEGADLVFQINRTAGDSSSCNAEWRGDSMSSYNTSKYHNPRSVNATVSVSPCCSNNNKSVCTCSIKCGMFRN